jgi:hypothetical protein
MAGFADLFYLGRPDPARQLAAMLSGQQQPGPPPGPPPGAPPAGAAPPPVDPNAPAPGAQPVAAAAPAGAPGATQNPAPGDAAQNAPTVPNVLKSTPDMSQSYQQLANPPNLMSLYLQMQQKQSAEDGINRGLALITANHSPPSMREAIMQSMTGGQSDTGQTVNNLMSLHTAMQQQGAMQDMLAHASDYDTKLGLPPGTARDMIIQGKGPDLVAKMEPTDQQRNIAAEHDAFIKSGGSEEDWKNNYLPMIITGGIPGATGDMRSMAIARTQWNADQANQGRPMPSYLTDPTKWSLYNKDLGDAKSSFGGMNQALSGYINDLGEVGASPELKNVAGKPFVGALAASVPGTPGYQLLTKMQGLAGTSKAMAARGGPKGVGQNLAVLGANTEDFTNLGITDYGDSVIAPRMKNALTAQANAYGAAGRLADMPNYLKPYLDPMYQPGGDLDPGGGFKPVKPNKDLKQPTQENMDDFKHNLEHFGPEIAKKMFRDNGIDTSSVE